MARIPDSVRDLFATGQLAQVVTIDPDGMPHVTLGWAGLDGDEVVMATFFNVDQRKLRNIRRDPRVAVCVVAKEHAGERLHPYAVIEGRARISEGGALEVMTAWRSSTSAQERGTRCATLPTASSST